MKLTISVFIGKEKKIERKLNIDVDEKKTIRALKEQIESELSERYDIWKLLYGLITLEDLQTLSSYSVADGATIEVYGYIRNGEMQLIIEYNFESKNNAPFSVTCERNAKTEKLVTRIQERAPFSTETGYLLNNGEQLVSGRTLVQQGVRENSRIVVATRTVGGYTL